MGEPADHGGEDQSWFWTDEWQAGEREADREIAAGLGMYFDSEEELDAHLDQIPLPPSDEHQRL